MKNFWKTKKHPLETNKIRATQHNYKILKNIEGYYSSYFQVVLRCSKPNPLSLQESSVSLVCLSLSLWPSPSPSFLLLS